MLTEKNVLKGGRLTKWKGQVASIAPSLFLGSVSALAVASGSLADTISNARTTAFSTTSNADHTVTSTGSVIVDPLAGLGAIEINVADYTRTLTVNGAVSGLNGTGADQAAIRFQGLSGSAVLNAPLTIANAGTAAGVKLTGALSGSITNDGTISATANNTSARADGFHLQNGMTGGSFINNGALTITATGSSSGAQANGITIDNGVSGTFVNNGSITIVSTATSGSAIANDGIDLEGTLTGTMTNNGAITMTVRADASSNATADGIQLETLNGAFTGTGDISIVMQNGSGVTAEGYDVTRVGASGTLLNTGNISVRSDAGFQIDLTGFRVWDKSLATPTTATLEGTAENRGAISVTANGSSSVTAVGIGVNGTLASTGHLLNSGTITVSANGSTSPVAKGIEASFVDGRITNSGQITVTARGTSSVSAAGVDIFNTLSGTVTNSGAISVTSTGDRTSARAFDLNTLTGTLDNQAALTVVANGSSGGSAVGIAFRGLSSTGQITNSGTINVRATGTSFASAAGIFGRHTDIDGTITNTGDLTLTATAQTSIFAQGIGFSNLATGSTLTNSGNIALTVTGNGPTNPGRFGASGAAFGSGLSVGTVATGAMLKNSGNISIATTVSGALNAGGTGVSATDIDGTFDNSGSITVAATVSDANGGSSAGVTGIGTRSVSGTFKNSGTITLTTNNAASSASAAGLDLGAIAATGVAENTGAITMTANGQGSVTARGFELSQTAGRFTNSGDLSVTARSTTGSAFATGGLSSNVAAGGQITNSGKLTISATGRDTVEANGLKVATDNFGTVTHSGSITVSATDTSGTTATARGISINNHVGTLNVTGDIAVSGNGTNHAIYLGSGTGTLNILGSAVIADKIRVADHNVNLTHAGNAAIYNFEDANTAAGTFSTLSSNANWVWAVSGAGTAAPVYTAVNTGSFSSAVGTAGAITGLVSGLAGQLSGEDQNQTSRGLFGEEQPVSTFAAASWNRISNQTTNIEMQGVQAGTRLTSQNGHNFGFALAAFNYSGTEGTTSLGAEGTYLSGMYALNWGGLAIDIGLGAGRLSNDTNRAITGSPNALASFDSDFVMGSLAARQDFSVAQDTTLTAFGSFILGQQNIDGYTETGSLANATVGAQTITFRELSLGAELSRPTEGGLVKASLSAIHRTADAPAGSSITVLGNALTGAAVSMEDTFAKVSVGFDRYIGTAGALSIGMSTNIGGNTSEQQFSARYTFDF